MSEAAFGPVPRLERYIKELEEAGEAMRYWIDQRCRFLPPNSIAAEDGRAALERWKSALNRASPEGAK